MKTTFYLLIILTAIFLNSCTQNNYSEATIAAFFDLDRSLKQSHRSLQWDRDFLLREMEETTTKKIHYRPIVEQAKKAVEATKEFQSYIDEQRQSLVEQTGGYFTEEEALTLGKPYLTMQPKGYQEEKLIKNTFLGQDSVGYKIQTKFQALIDTYLTLATELWDVHAVKGTIFNDPSKKEPCIHALQEDFQSRTFGASFEKVPQHQDWTNFTFEDKSLAALYPLLRQFEHDATMAQLEFLSFVASNLYPLCNWNYETFDAMAVTTNPIVLQGGTYEAAIFVGDDPKATLNVSVNGKKLPIEAGKATYRTQNNTVGEHKYTARIDITNPLTGEVETFSKVFHYKVLPNCNNN